MPRYIKNLISTDAFEGKPWEFQCTENITEEIRKNKSKRQEWYSNPGTDHSFYSFVEPINPNFRVNKDSNPPHSLSSFLADFDTLNLSQERILEGIALMPIKPTRIEQSLGYNWRLQFDFEQKLMVQGHDFCQFLLRESIKWLRLDILPCLDTQAYISPTRYYCNGCLWLPTGFGPIPQATLQAFLVTCARNFDFRAASSDTNVPLDVVEKELRRKYPKEFNWPGPFELESQGPTFWVPESKSPMSAVVKEGGMYSFSMNVETPFSSWSKLLGAEFVQQFNDASIFTATDGIYHDGHDYWLKGIEGNYRSAIKDELQNFLKVNCRLTNKADKETGDSQVDLAMNHIYRQNRISSAGSFVCQKPGLLISNGERCLNTYNRKPLAPTGRPVTWDDLPFIHGLWRHMFETDRQFWHFIAWLKHFYTSAYEWTPRQGQNSFFAGVKNSGKTLTNCFIIPPLVGGGMDATEYIMDKSIFNAHLYEVPFWTIDDETVIGSPANMQRTANMFKKTAANRQGISHAKFRKQSMVTWCGRLGVTLNMDPHSMRIIGPQDDATLEKTNLFRCNTIPKDFPPPQEIAKYIAEELPHLARMLLDVTIPDFVKPYGRYGFEAYHDELLLDRTNQSQSIAPFKEMLGDELTAQFYNGDPLWKATVTQIMRLLSGNILNEHSMRSIRMDQVNRYLEQIEKEGLWGLRCETGPMRTRLWVFEARFFKEAILARFGKLHQSLPAPEEAAPQAPAPTTKNPFEI